MKNEENAKGVRLSVFLVCAICVIVLVAFMLPNPNRKANHDEVTTNQPAPAKEDKVIEAAPVGPSALASSVENISVAPTNTHVSRETNNTLVLDFNDFKLGFKDKP